MRRSKRLRPWFGLAVVAAGALVALTPAAVLARSNATPVNTAPPTVTGTEREGQTLTAGNGTWSNNPTSFEYKWQRCTIDGTACGDIAGATEKTYKPVQGDVGHALAVEVTAVNADGRATAASQPTDPISDASGPNNTVRPALSGSATVGEELQSTTGTWSPTPTSTTRQWQRCDSDNTDCRNIVGATGQTYGVRAGDAGHRLRVLVTARTASGVSYATSNTSAAVPGGSTSTTTTTVSGNKAPTLTFLSLRRVGVRVYARFRVCDDKLGKTTIIERDNKARALAAQRKFAVVRRTSCATFARNWVPASRFRTPGRYVVTLRAVDTSGRLSLIRSRSLVRR